MRWQILEMDRMVARKDAPVVIRHALCHLNWCCTARSLHGIEQQHRIHYCYAAILQSVNIIRGAIHHILGQHMHLLMVTSLQSLSIIAPVLASALACLIPIEV